MSTWIVESWTINLVLLTLIISGIMFDDSGKLRFGCICAAVINLTMAVAVLVLLILSKVGKIGGGHPLAQPNTRIKGRP